MLPVPALIGLAGCRSDPPLEQSPKASISAADEDASQEAGNEGDEDSLPPVTAAVPPGTGTAALLGEAKRRTGACIDLLPQDARR